MRQFVLQIFIKGIDRTQTESGLVGLQAGVSRVGANTVAGVIPLFCEAGQSLFRLSDNFEFVLLLKARAQNDLWLSLAVSVSQFAVRQGPRICSGSVQRPIRTVSITSDSRITFSRLTLCALEI